MFIEEIFNPINDSNINDFYFENLIIQLKDRVELSDINLNNDSLYEDELYIKLNRCISNDLYNIDMMLGNYLKDTILKYYIKMKSKENNVDEFNELKWFLLERLQGYMPCSHRVLYDI